MPAERPMMKSNENRRSNKPIMEKRRRARINSCLNELKALILEALKKDPARHSKLEKADILEMTVKHLQNLQRQQIALQTASNPNVTNKFRAGYHECASEVSKYLRQIDVDTGAQQRLLNHLSNCIEFLNRSDFHVLRTTNVATQPLNIRVTSLTEGPMGQLTPLPTPNSLDKSPNSSLPVPFDYHLVPTTRMANGDLAVLLHSPPPTLIRNTFPEVNKRLSPVSRQEIIPQFGFSSSAVALQQGSVSTAFILPSSHSPIDLCGGPKGGKMMTCKEPWRPW